jgi:hypothetical protein
MLTPTSGFNLFSFHLISALQVLSTLAFLQQKRMGGKCFANIVLVNALETASLRSIEC